MNHSAYNFHRLPNALAFLAAALFFSFAWAGQPGETLSQDNGFDIAMSEDMLADQRGMAVTNTNDLDAYLYENSVVDAVTGGNLISDGSLANNAGLSTVIQNSGNNVLIQNALILNIQVQ